MKNSSVQCIQCGLVLDESGNEALEERKPCPQCGSLGRHFGILVTDSVTIREDIALKSKREGDKKPYLESKSGDSFSVKHNKWYKRVRSIDRDNDHYEEQIVDPDTGMIIHGQSEPLSMHVGHGSAKFKVGGGNNGKK